MTAKQIEAISLLAQGRTQEEVARVVGVSSKTISRWLKNTAFAEALEAHQKQTLDRVVARTAENWADSLSQTSLEHFQSSRQYRALSVLVVKSLLAELKVAEAKGAEAYQAAIAKIRSQANLCNAWNQILDRSIKLERTVLGLDYEDVSHAIAFLQRLGYEVTDPTQVDTTTEPVVTKGLTEKQLNQIKAGILGVSEN